MVETLIIAAFVIIVDIVLRAFVPDISRQLGPYVGLIITNCIIMGRMEAFALANPPGVSFMDGIASGLGYAYVLLTVAVFRELLGAGTLLGHAVLSGAWYEANLIFLLAPGAFFTSGFLIWALNALRPSQPEEESE